ncbi:MAG: hypothetical protein AAF412_01020 [Pseudomonadota bacterium]
MNQFTFEARDKRVLIGFMLLGLICLGWTFLIDDVHHPRFWSNFLHNTVFFTGIGFISLFILTAFITAYAGWYTIMKREFKTPIFHNLFSESGIPGFCPHRSTIDHQSSATDQNIVDLCDWQNRNIKITPKIAVIYYGKKLQLFSPASDIRFNR